MARNNISNSQSQVSKSESYENNEQYSSNRNYETRNQMEASNDIGVQNHPNSPLNDFNNSNSCKDCYKDNCDCNNNRNNNQ